MRIVWTEPALQDLAAARTYISLDQPGAADRQVLLILAAVASLPNFPESGRLSRRPGTRELVVSKTPYLLPYRIRSNTIEILRVLHGRQRWPGQF